MLRSLTAPLYQTLTTTQRLHIIWQSVRRSEAPPPPPHPQKINKRQLWDVPLQISQTVDEKALLYIHDAGMFARKLSPSTRPKPKTQPPVSRTGPLLGDAELFGVWPWGESPLWKSPLWVPPTGRISVRVSLKTRQKKSQRGKICMTENTHWETMRSDFLNLKKRKIWHFNFKKKNQWKNSFLWTGPACAFCSPLSTL